MKFYPNVLIMAAFVFGALFFTGCNTASNTASNTATTNKANTAASNTATSTPAANAANTATSNSEAKTENAPAGDSVGVAECDEYVKKYEACLTKVAAKAPQVEGSLKTAFEIQRNAIKSGASTPQGKAALATSCKQMLETAKKNAALTAYSCEW